MKTLIKCRGCDYTWENSIEACPQCRSKRVVIFVELPTKAKKYEIKEIKK